MNEPDNHAAIIDRFGDTWVRDDDTPSRYGPWWPILDGPKWGAPVTVGMPRDWPEVEEYGPFTPADPERTAAALERVRLEVTS